MKRVTCYLFLGLLLAFLQDRVAAKFCYLVSQQTHYRLFEIYGNGIAPEILVVGNSRAMQSVNGRIISNQLGVKAYNAGINGAPPHFVCALAKDAIDAHPSIKALMIEASCFWPISASVDIKPIANQSTRMFDILQQDDPLSATFIKVSHLYAYNSEAFLRALFFLRNSDQDGYSSGIINADIINAPFVERFAADVPPVYCNMLEDLQSFADLRGVRLILFVAPYHRSAFERFPDFNALLLKIRGARREVWDFSKFFLEDETFADRLHLNGVGARQFSISLAEKISSSLGFQNESGVHSAGGSNIGSK